MDLKVCSFSCFFFFISQTIQQIIFFVISFAFSILSIFIFFIFSLTLFNFDLFFMELLLFFRCLMIIIHHPFCYLSFFFFRKVQLLMLNLMRLLKSFVYIKLYLLPSFMSSIIQAHPCQLLLLRVLLVLFS
jgi:hypothetical protein